MDDRALTSHIDQALRAALGDHGGLLLIAVSGGADSMALWDLMTGLRRWSLAVYHLNHQLRGDADCDGEVIRRQHAAYGQDAVRMTPLIIESCAIADYAARWRCSVELAGRRHRYARLTALAQDLRAVAVLTAHHRDDQAETVLGNLLRGAGPIGRAGIAPHRMLAPGLPVVRPLLGVRRESLRAHALRRQLTWREDSTNADTSLRRNFLRLSVLPALEGGCPGITDALVDLGQHAQGEIREGAVQTASVWQAAWSGRQLALAPLDGLPVEARWRMWRSVLVHLGVTPERRHLTALERLAAGAIGEQLTLGHWLLARRRSTLTWQLQRPVTSPESITMAATGTISRGGEWIHCVHEPAPAQVARNARWVTLDDHALSWPLVWRLSHGGERWLPLGSPGHQTVIKYLANRGVPSRLRPLTAVVADQCGIIWIPGHGIAERAKVRTDTTRVLRLEWRPPCQNEGDARVAHAPSAESTHGTS